MNSASGIGSPGLSAEVLHPVIVRRNHQLERDAIIGGEAGQFIGVLHGEIHGHGRHVAGNGFVLDGDGVPVGGNFPDNAATRIGLR
jgi:hypothetical protein